MRLVATILALAALAAPAEALATVTSSLVGGQLVVASDGSDSISITCAAGLVKVNGADPGTGPAVCTSVSHVTVSGGPGANTLDVSEVTQASFGPYVPCALFGGAGTDVIVGSQVFNHIDGGPGSDAITGGPGADDVRFVGTHNAETIIVGQSQIQNGPEVDTHTGVENVEVLGAAGDDHLIGSTGNDTLNGGDGNNTVDGGAGIDYLQLFGTPGPDAVTAVPGTGTVSTSAEKDTYSGIEQFQLSGQDGADTLTASGARDFMTGGDGADTLVGGGEGDVFVGSAGDDTIRGGDGHDFAEGGPGSDTLVGGAGTDGLIGDEGNDMLDGGDGPDALDGGTGDDTLRGGAAGDTLKASAGSDALDGEDGPDLHIVAFGALGTVGVGDTGGSGSDSLEIVNCSGVTVTATQAIRGAEVVNYSGIEAAPCRFGPPPPPPPVAPPPPPATPPPTQQRPIARCVVPKVKNKTLRAARKAIASRRCRVGKVRFAYSRVRKGRVVAQTPRAGRRLARGARVNLVVSRGTRRR